MRPKLFRIIIFCITAWLVNISLTVFSQYSGLFQHKAYQAEDQVLPYRIMFPYDFNPEIEYPLILFLHGAGERGNDNEKQLVHGGSFFADETNRQKFPAVVVFPQCPQNIYWAKVNFSYDPNGKRSFSFDPDGEPTMPMKLAMMLLDSLLNENWVDKSRVYMGGLSMGGMGTFELLYRKPEVFAAAFPICGGGNPDLINQEILNLKVWAFHGQDDDVVPAELSEKMIEAYFKAGSNARLTIYPDVGHNAWDYVFREPDLLPWLFSIRR